MWEVTLQIVTCDARVLNTKLGWEDYVYRKHSCRLQVFNILEMHWEMTYGRQNRGPSMVTTS